MAKSASETEIRQMAFDLAATGPFEGWQEIQLLLQYAGYTDARSALGDEATRQLLDQRCRATSGRFAA